MAIQLKEYLANVYLQYVHNKMPESIFCLLHRFVTLRFAMNEFRYEWSANVHNQRINENIRICMK